MKSAADIYYDLARMGEFNPSDPWELTMTRTLPSAKQMEDSRKTHYFRDDEGERLVVMTEMMPNGEYGAWIDNQEDTEPHGIGDTMMEAIFDLARQREELK